MAIRRIFLKNFFLGIAFVAVRCVYKSKEQISPKISITQDFGDQPILFGDLHKISWQATEDIFTLNVYFSSDSGNSWKLLYSNIPSKPNFINWMIAESPQNGCLIKIVNSQNGQESISNKFDILNSYELNLDKFPALLVDNGFIEYYDYPYGNLFITNENGQIKIIDLACTHAGCGTSYNSGNFYCRCHGSVFDKDGAVINGPAEKPLNRIKYKNKEVNKILIY